MGNQATGAAKTDAPAAPARSVRSAAEARPSSVDVPRALGNRGAQRELGGALESIDAGEVEAEPPAPTAVARLLVEDDAPSAAPGQMRRSDFLDALRAAVCATTDEGLAGTGQDSRGCPWIDYWFAFYADKGVPHLERSLRRFAPETAGAREAGEAVRLLAARVRRSVDGWARTGEIAGVPAEVPLALPGAAALGGIFFYARPGPAAAASPVALRAQLGPGRALEGGLRGRMEGAFGASFAHVRAHTDAGAARLVHGLNAQALTVGEHVAFAPGMYRPGSVWGDALVAHELAHTLQQAGPGGAPRAAGGVRRLEQEADSAALGAVETLWGAEHPEILAHAPAGAPRAVRPSHGAGLRVQLSSCGTTPTPPVRAPVQPAPPETVDQTMYDAAVAALRSRLGQGAVLEAILARGQVGRRVPGVRSTRFVDPGTQPPTTLNVVFDLEVANDPALLAGHGAAALFQDDPRNQTSFTDPPNVVVTRLLRIVVKRPRLQPFANTLGEALVHEGTHMLLAIDRLLANLGLDSAHASMTGALRAFTRYTDAAAQSPRRATLAASLVAELGRTVSGDAPTHATIADTVIARLLEERFGVDEQRRAFTGQPPVSNTLLAEAYVFDLLAQEAGQPRWPRSARHDEIVAQAAALLDEVAQAVAAPAQAPGGSGSPGAPAAAPPPPVPRPKP